MRVPAVNRFPCFFLALLLCVPLAALAYSHVRIVRLTLVQGSVWVTRPGSPEPVRAVEHQPLEHAAVVETVAGVAEIEFEDRTFVRLASGSRLHLAELGLEDNGDRVTHLSLEQGTATFDVRPHRGDSVVLLAPQVTIFFHQKARVRVDLAPSAKRVRVFRGRITLETRADTLSLTAGQMLEWVSDSGSYRIARNPSADGWDEWNDKRAETLAALVNYTSPSVVGGGAATQYSSSWGGAGYGSYCGSWRYDPFFNSWMWSPYPPTGYYTPYGWGSFFGFSRSGCALNGFWWSPGGYFFGWPAFHRRPIPIRVRRRPDPPARDSDDSDGSTTARTRRRPRRPVDREERSPLFGSRPALRTPAGAATRVEGAESRRTTSPNATGRERAERRAERQQRRQREFRRQNRSRPSVRRVQPRSSGRQVRRSPPSRRPSSGTRSRTVRRPARSSSSRPRSN